MMTHSPLFPLKIFLVDSLEAAFRPSFRSGPHVGTEAQNRAKIEEF